MPLAGQPHTRRVSAAEVEAALGTFDALDPIGDRSGSGECWVATAGADRHVVKIIVHEHSQPHFLDGQPDGQLRPDPLPQDGLDGDRDGQGQR